MSTKELVDFIKEISFELIPDEVVAMAKIPITDCLGVTLAGCSEEASKIMCNYVAESGGQPEAGVIGAGFRTSAAQAAWVNGTMAHILDYDDYFLPYHPSVAILPAILAIAEKFHLSGRDVLLSYITGFEVEACISAVMGRTHYERGWHSTSVLGSLGATAAVAKLLKLDESKIRIALGIVGSLAGGLRKNFGSMTKSLHAGNSNRNAIVAAMLAKNGFTANENILEGTLGFLEVLGCKGNLDIQELGHELGKNYYLKSVGISIKPYPSCAGTHWVIDAALDLKRQTNIDIEEIADIECITGPEVPRILIHSRPKTGLEGKFSLEYCIAVAFLDGEVSLKQFTDERILDPKIAGLIGKIRYSHPPEMGTGLGDKPCEMKVTYKDGKTTVCREKKPKGHSTNQLSPDELNRKFSDCVRRCLSPSDTEKVLKQLSHLESISDITGLMHSITFLKVA